MYTFNPHHPLIFIHVPKTAGTSVRQVFSDWFGANLLEHYFDEVTLSLPERRGFARLSMAANPVCIYGHFNRLREFSIEDYYPEAMQFLTILREPFNMALSHYHFVRNVGGVWADQSRIPTSDLEHHLLNAPLNMLNHFPREITRENYRDIIDEFFLHVGFTEALSETLSTFAEILDKDFDPSRLEHLNPTDWHSPDIVALKDRFYERHSLEVEVYLYCKRRFRIDRSV